MSFSSLPIGLETKKVQVINYQSEYVWVWITSNRYQHDVNRYFLQPHLLTEFCFCQKDARIAAQQIGLDLLMGEPFNFEFRLIDSSNTGQYSLLVQPLSCTQQRSVPTLAALTAARVACCNFSIREICMVPQSLHQSVLPKHIKPRFHIPDKPTPLLNCRCGR